MAAKQSAANDTRVIILHFLNEGKETFRNTEIAKAINADAKMKNSIANTTKELLKQGILKHAKGTDLKRRKVIYKVRSLPKLELITDIDAASETILNYITKPEEKHITGTGETPPKGAIEHKEEPEPQAKVKRFSAEPTAEELADLIADGMYRLMKKHEYKAMQLEDKIAELERRLQEKDKRIAEKQEQIAKLNAAIARMNPAYASRTGSKFKLADLIPDEKNPFKKNDK